MSRTKSIKAILPALPPDISQKEAARSFNRESACHLRAMATNAERLARHWEKIRSHRPNPWRVLVDYMSKLTQQELELEESMI